MAYPNVNTFEALGHGNILLDGQFAWPDNQISKSWSGVYGGTLLSEGKDSSFKNEVGIFDPQQISGSVVQSVNLPTRAQEIPGHTVRVGGRFGTVSSGAGSASLVLWGWNGSSWNHLGGQNFSITASQFNTASWRTDPKFVEFEAFVPSNVTDIDYRFYMHSLAVDYVGDDLYVICKDCE